MRGPSAHRNIECVCMFLVRLMEGTRGPRADSIQSIIFNVTPQQETGSGTDSE